MLKDDNRCSPTLQNAQRLRIGPGCLSYAGIRIEGNYLTDLCVGKFSSQVELERTLRECKSSQESWISPGTMEE
jgi:hypothetical protein